jgi:SPP1 gp7 family putative phage head morphogenesis protein
MSYPDFVNRLKELKLKKKGARKKVAPNKFYPHKIELQTVELIREELKDYCSRLQEAAFNGSVNDGVEDVVKVLGDVPDKFKERVEVLAHEVSAFNSLAFAEFSELTIGERYFPNSANQEEIIAAWTDNFVNLCKSANEEIRKKVASKVSDGVLSGKNIREVRDDVRNMCTSFTSSKADLIAVTEVGKLNSAIERCQCEDAGIDYYEWSAAMDGRTRESHALMDGKICKWGDDDHYWEWETGEDGKRKLVRKNRTEKMYHGAPGTDFRCRCVALPYVPEYEDDYEAERENGEQRGVVQTHENPKPMSAEHIRFMNAINESRLMMNKSRDPGNIEANLLRKREKADYELQMARDYSDVSKRPYDKKLNSFYNLWCRKDGSDKLNEYLMRKNLGKGNPGNHPIFDEREKMMNDYIRSTPMRRDMTLWRAMSLNEATLNAYRKKKVIFNPGIASFSKSMEHSASFYDPNSKLKNKVSFFIQLHAKKGDPIAPPYRIKNGRMVGYPEESEFNSPSKSNLRIIEERDSNGILILECSFEG